MENYKGIIAKWHFDKNEKGLIDYCDEKGYRITKCKQYQSKTKFTFIVDGFEEWYEIYNIPEFKFDKKHFQRGIDLRVELESLRNKSKQI